MIKIENTEVVGWEHAIRGMRNPKNSWDRMDSYVGGCGTHVDDCDGCPGYRNEELCDAVVEGKYPVLGPNDHKLMMQLANGGPVHAKYRRMIAVYVDITAPLYWWKEFDTYKVGTVANSCSTMHKIHAKEFELSDFSYEHLLSDPDCDEDGPYHEIKEPDGEGYRWYAPKEILEDWIIPSINKCRAEYLKTKTKPMKEESKRAELMKKYWWQMIQLLPSSYNQKRTVMLNYEVLVGMYRDRKNHKLDEWYDFCDWIEELPYSELICGPKFLEKKMNL